METYFLKENNLRQFYGRIARDFELYVPAKAKSGIKVKCDHSFILPTDDYLLKKYSELDKEDIVFNEYRPIEPARAFFTHPKEEVCYYFDETENHTPEVCVGLKEDSPVAICGFKNCDLFSLRIQDFVFLGGNEQDQLYRIRRESALIISGDCPSFKEACFCRAFDIDPYVVEGFDFNLAPVTGGYLVDVASDKARKIASGLKDIMPPANSSQIGERELSRESVAKRLDEHLSYHKIPKKEVLKEIVLAGYNSEIWQEEMKTCVECGGCVFMCDTCHCFLLSDEPTNHTPGVSIHTPGVCTGKRKRIWDGCLYKNFATVAGGANPLRMRYMRLRNRYLKKFDFFIDNIGYQACCGCGRCIDVCPGRIDIRRILRTLYEEKYIPTH